MARMNTKWTSTAIDGNTDAPPSLKDPDRFVVLLLHGKNSFDDKIYSFLKIKLPDLQRLKSAILAGNGFTPSDFGTVIAAGLGNPTDEVRAEISSSFDVLDAQELSRPAPVIPSEKKNWDEY